LLIDTFTYDPCLLITITDSVFGVIGMQTNNIIILGDKRFSAQEEYELIYANYITKLKEKLLVVILLLFNSCVFSLDGTNMNLY
jgi:hypothetical protein